MINYRTSTNSAIHAIVFYVKIYGTWSWPQIVSPEPLRSHCKCKQLTNILPFLLWVSCNERVIQCNYLLQVGSHDPISKNCNWLIKYVTNGIQNKHWGVKTNLRSRPLAIYGFEIYQTNMNVVPVLIQFITTLQMKGNMVCITCLCIWLWCRASSVVYWSRPRQADDWLKYF